MFSNRVFPRKKVLIEIVNLKERSIILSKNNDVIAK